MCHCAESDIPQVLCGKIAAVGVLPPNLVVTVL